MRQKFNYNKSFSIRVNKWQMRYDTNSIRWESCNEIRLSNHISLKMVCFMIISTAFQWLMICTSCREACLIYSGKLRNDNVGQRRDLGMLSSLLLLPDYLREVYWFFLKTLIGKEQALRLYPLKGHHKSS